MDANYHANYSEGYQTTFTNFARSPYNAWEQKQTNHGYPHTVPNQSELIEHNKLSQDGCETQKAVQQCEFRDMTYIRPF